jgi:hypothetical protein
LTYILVVFVERLGTRLADAMNSGRIGFHLPKEVRGVTMMRRIRLILWHK